MKKVILVFAVTMFFAPGARAEESALEKIHLGGTYIGILNLIRQDNKTAADPSRNHFDYAMNLDVNGQIHPKVKVNLQFHGGAGAGALGFADSDVLLADYNLEIDAHEKFLLTVGSFDTPLGMQVGSLTNNADTFPNALILNPLSYAALGGQVNTLNTLGVKGDYKTNFADFTLAIANGTDETAKNDDGNFEYVLGAKTNALKNFALAGTYMESDDIDASGTSGFAADFKAWVLEGQYTFKEGMYLKGYYGSHEYGDDIAATEDKVKVWMGEAACQHDKWSFALRLSEWSPDDGNGDGAGISALLPNAGLAVTQGGVAPVTDQKIQRFQIGGGWHIDDNLMLKAEWFMDDYKQKSGGANTDVSGFLFAINGNF